MLPEVARQALRQRVSHREIQEKLGEGGVGVVSQARDTCLARRLAPKVVKAQFSESSEQTGPESLSAARESIGSSSS